MTELPEKLSEELVKSISQLLIDAGVPSVLWGDCLLTIYGVPSIVGVSNQTSTLPSLIANI